MTIISNYDPKTSVSICINFNMKSMLFTVTQYCGKVRERLFTNQRDAEAQLDEWVKEQVSNQ